MKVIRLEVLQRFAEELGYDSRDISSVTIRPRTVEVQTFARDGEGNLLTRGGTPVRTLHIHPVEP